MTLEELEYLKSEQAQVLIRQNLELDPLEVALNLQNSAVSTQIKNLQKSRTKLPAFYNARCVIPTISYQQSSSEATARAKFSKLMGEVAIDLTCGLGVDALFLSRSFKRVITIEKDSIKAEVARHNFQLLGAKNIEVVNSSAEEYIANGLITDFPKVDLIYLDPSRRAESGKVLYSIEHSEPNVLELLPALRKNAHMVMVKLSPMFDVLESYRLFGEDSHCNVISVDNECKEVVVTIRGESPAAKLYSSLNIDISGSCEPLLRNDCEPQLKNDDCESLLRNDDCEPLLRNDCEPLLLFKKTQPPALSVTAIRLGETSRFDFSRKDIQEIPLEPDLTPKYLLQPDVGFYKSRTVSALISKEICYYRGGYILMESPPDKFCGTLHRITEYFPYKPKTLRKRFQQAILHQRDFPYSNKQIGIRQGGNTHLFFMTFRGEPTVFITE